MYNRQCDYIAFNDDIVECCKKGKIVQSDCDFCPYRGEERKKVTRNEHDN